MKLNNKKILMMGLPGTGKTTFLGAFWYYVSHWLKDRKLVVDTLEASDEQYLNSICDTWLNYEMVQRTVLNNPTGEPVLMKLKQTETEASIVLEIPDLSGETFKLQTEHREWSNDFDKLLNKTTGLVIFIDALDKEMIGKSLMDAILIEAELGHNDHEQQKEETQKNEKVVDWDPTMIPSQNRIIEFLQFLIIHKPDLIPLRIALIVSAWDKVIELNPDELPNKWLELNAPLLHQFLLCNSNIFTLEVFGISAQGGDYKDEKVMKSLTEKEAINRVIVNKNGVVSNDITQPILWVTQ